MRESTRTGKLKAALLVAVIVLAQAAALAHLGIDDSHPIDETCAFCLSLANYSAGNVSSPFEFDVFVEPSHRIAFQAFPSQSIRLLHQPARGPPVTS